MDHGRRDASGVVSWNDLLHAARVEHGECDGVAVHSGSGSDEWAYFLIQRLLGAGRSLQKCFTSEVQDDQGIWSGRPSNR